MNLLSKSILISMAVVCTGLLSGCCVLFIGPTSVIDISSQPKGAKITIDGRDYGVTPKSVTLNGNGRLLGESKSKKEYSVKITLDGYKPYEVKLTRKMNGLYLVNILFPVGLIIDARNGSMYKLTQEQVNAQLVKMSTASIDNKNSLYIAVTLNPDPTWEKFGNLAKE